MSRNGLLQGRRQGRRIEDRLGNRALILDRKTDDADFLDGLMSGLLGGGNDEVADATALDFGRAFDDSQRFRRDAGLKASGAVRFL